MLRSFIVVTAAAAALAMPALAEEGHEDIWVTSSGGQLVTGGWDHETGEITSPFLRVFKADMGEDPEFPFSIDEPGTYLAPLQLYSTAAGVEASEEFWLVLNGGSDAASFAAALSAAMDAMDPACTGDIDASGAVDGADLGVLLSSWGSSGPADLDLSGIVDGADLGMLLSAWGGCP